MSRPRVCKRIVTKLLPPLIRIHVAELKWLTEGHSSFCRILLQWKKLESDEFGFQPKAEAGLAAVMVSAVEFPAAHSFEPHEW